MQINSIQGLIFDLDGTLVNSMPLHFKAWTQALAEHGGINIFPEDVFYSFGGRSAIDVVTILNSKFNLEMNPKLVAERKRAIYISLLHQDGVKPIKQVINFIRKNSHLPRAIATGSALPGACETLKCAGIQDLFSCIVTPENVKNGKPAPDMFLLAAKKINTSPENCLVFEDASPGLIGAKKANMQWAYVDRNGDFTFNKSPFFID